MIVVSDTGPINYLVLTESAELLPTLFQQVAIPSVVLEELVAPGGTQFVREWVSTLPQWISVREALEELSDERGGRGELAAIALAKELQCPILCDDVAGRKLARREGLLVSGTLGVLHRAHVLGLIDIERALERLVNETNFYLTDKLREKVMRDAIQGRSAYKGEAAI